MEAVESLKRAYDRIAQETSAREGYLKQSAILESFSLPHSPEPLGRVAMWLLSLMTVSYLSSSGGNQEIIRAKLSAIRAQLLTEHPTHPVSRRSVEAIDAKLGSFNKSRKLVLGGLFAVYGSFAAVPLLIFSWNWFSGGRVAAPAEQLRGTYHRGAERLTIEPGWLGAGAERLPLGELDVERSHGSVERAVLEEGVFLDDLCSLNLARRGDSVIVTVQGDSHSDCSVFGGEWVRDGSEAADRGVPRSAAEAASAAAAPAETPPH
jgi:hypothetical protein